MELYHILYPVQKSEIFFKKIVCPIKMLPSPQKCSISIKKKEKEKIICLLAPIFVNQKSKELKINMVWPYNNKSTNLSWKTNFASYQS
jgi:hypothetical protein